MTDEFLETFAGAVEGKLCGVSTCTAQPVAERNGRALCVRHRDHHDHSTMGEPCDHCGSRQWATTPDAPSSAVCAVCDYVEYDESVTEGSW